jgi:hypothetical protein
MEGNQARLQRALSVLGDIRESRSYDTTTIPVALRELANLLTAVDRLS